jgi:hypothetical protein
VLVVVAQEQPLLVEDAALAGALVDQAGVAARQGVDGGGRIAGLGGGVVAGWGQHGWAGSSVGSGAQEVAGQRGGLVGDLDGLAGPGQQRDRLAEGVTVGGVGVRQPWVVQVVAQEIERLPVVLAGAQ